MWDEAEAGRHSKPPAFPGGGGGLNSTADDYHAYFRMLLNHGTHQGGWGFGMAVRTYRGDYAPVGQFGWDGGSGTSTYADPVNGIVGVLLTQVGATVPSATQLMLDFWTTLYQAI
ncbi:hypothetical protein AB0E69_24055 [Kribbella sp. NPDC026611]|uniref:hypothetical protein n=1 Tax=Kribbella sp. NPDC026611 TaxID=3154911 RepID=UPI0033D0C8F9